VDYLVVNDAEGHASSGTQSSTEAKQQRGSGSLLEIPSSHPTTTLHAANQKMIPQQDNPQVQLQVLSMFQGSAQMMAHSKLHCSKRPLVYQKQSTT
jgi:hypothetical protein